MNSRGQKLISLILIISLLILPMTLTAKERRGADLKIQKKDGQELQGELITVKKESLLLKDAGSGADVSVDVSDINKITIVRKSWGWKGVLLIGGGLGLIGGIAAIGEEEHGFIITFIECFIWGALIGVIVGAVAGTDKTIKIEGKSDSEIKGILEDLRKKARVQDFK